MLKLTLVWCVTYCISRAVGKSAPEHETFVITKNRMAHKCLLFGGVQRDETLRLVINKINQSGAVIASTLLDWIIVFL